MGRQRDSAPISGATITDPVISDHVLKSETDRSVSLRNRALAGKYFMKTKSSLLPESCLEHLFFAALTTDV
jgi:hypothetical protein